MSKEDRIQIRVSAEQRRSYDVARGDVPLAAWLRNLADEAAEGPLINLAELDLAYEGIPRTVVEFDEDGDIAIYRSGEFVDQPYDGPYRRKRREAVAKICPWTKRDPYVIEAKRVDSIDEAMDWMAHISEKTWADSPGFMRQLKGALLTVLKRRAKRPSPHRPSPTQPRVR